MGLRGNVRGNNDYSGVFRCFSWSFRFFIIAYYTIIADNRSVGVSPTSHAHVGTGDCPLYRYANFKASILLIYRKLISS